MKRKRLRVMPLAPAIALCLMVSLVPTPSNTAPPEPLQLPPSFDENLVRQDLAFWMAGSLPGRREPGATVISAADLAAALQQQPRQLELFQHGESAARSEVLRHLPYGSVLGRVCERNHVDSLLVAAVVEAESRFEADAVSPEGAVGLMQLLPSTGREYGVKNLFDPAANLDAGSRYLGGLLTRFGGDRELAVAAYNAGPEVVARYGRVPPFRETRDFVKKVMTSYRDHHDRVAALAVRAPDRDARRPARGSATGRSEPRANLTALGR